MVAEESASSSSRDHSCNSSMEEEEEGGDLYSHNRYWTSQLDGLGGSRTGWDSYFTTIVIVRGSTYGGRCLTATKPGMASEKAEGTKKPVVKVKNMLHSKKGEVGHFHALAEGLLRHIRHSTKSKNNLSKGGRGGNGNGNVALAANVSTQASQAAD